MHEHYQEYTVEIFPHFPEDPQPEGSIHRWRVGDKSPTSFGIVDEGDGERSECALAALACLSKLLSE